jgi:hypothetical protein
MYYGMGSVVWTEGESWLLVRHVKEKQGSGQARRRHLDRWVLVLLPTHTNSNRIMHMNYLS